MSNKLDKHQEIHYNYSLQEFLKALVSIEYQSEAWEIVDQFREGQFSVEGDNLCGEVRFPLSARQVANLLHLVGVDLTRNPPDRDVNNFSELFTFVGKYTEVHHALEVALGILVEGGPTGNADLLHLANRGLITPDEWLRIFNTLQCPSLTDPIKLEILTASIKSKNQGDIHGNQPNR